MTLSADRYTPLRPLSPFLLLVQDNDGTPVVLKRLPDPLLGDAAALHDFRLEAWRAAQLEGPRFVKAMADGTDTRDRPFYTMGYAEGPPATLVQPGDVPGCVRQLAEALAWLHRRGWVHAALEPTSLRRTEAGLVVVGYANLTPHGEIARRRGATAFQSPEQANGLPLDGRADLYSLGALIHFWLTGEPCGELDLLDLVADPLAALGRWCLAPATADRPRDAETLLAELDRLERAGGAAREEPETDQATAWLVPPRLPRAAALAPVAGLLAALADGQGAFRRLEGPAGLGKSTLLDLAAQQAQSAGWPVLRAEGQGAWASPLAPWRTLWRGLQAIAAERQPGLTERYKGRLGPLAEAPDPLQATPPASPWSSDVARARQLAALAELLAAVAPPGLVVMLDDWDLADEASRLALAQMRNRLGDAPVLWLVAGVAVGLEGAPPLALPPLTLEESQQLINGLLPAPPDDPALDTLVMTAMGHPGTLVGLVHHWIASGVHLGPGHPLPPAHTWPSDAEALATQIAASLPSRAAWTTGGHVALMDPLMPVLALDVLASEPMALASGVDALLCARVITRSRDGATYRFCHPAFHPVYSAALTPEAQTDAHRRLLALRPGDRLTRAMHAIRGEVPEEVAPAALEAARMVLAQGARETARMLLEEGVVTLPFEHAARGAYLGLLGEIARMEGQLEAATAFYQQAKEALPAGPERQGIALALAFVLAEQGRHADAIALWREAAGHATMLGDMDGLSLALSGLCGSQATLGQPDDAIASGEAALGAAAEAGPLARALAMTALGGLLALSGRERQSEGIALLQRASALFEAEGDKARLLATLLALGDAELARGELIFARDTAARARALAEELGDRPSEAQAERQASAALWALGDPAAADHAVRARTLAEASGLAADAAEAQGLEGLARLSAGDFEGAASLTGSAVGRLGPQASARTSARLWLMHAEALLGLNQFPEAAHALTEAQGPVKRAGRVDLEGQRGYLLGVWAGRSGDRERARQELRATLAQPNQWLVARAALALGRLATDVGARTEAAGWLEQARRAGLALGAEKLALEAERLERSLSAAADAQDDLPTAAADRLEALLQEARALVPRVTGPAHQVAALEVALAESRALTRLWSRLFQAENPRGVGLAVAEAAFACSGATRAFVLGRGLDPLAARAREAGDLPYAPSLILPELCRAALDSGQPASMDHVLALPLVAGERAWGVLYLVGTHDITPSLAAVAEAGGLGLERLLG